MKKITPIGHNKASLKLHREISSMLMDFVCNGQKPFSKKLNSFIATGCHDIRAGGVAIDILAKVQKYLDESND